MVAELSWVQKGNTWIHISEKSKGRCLRGRGYQVMSLGLRLSFSGPLSSMLPPQGGRGGQRWFPADMHYDGSPDGWTTFIQDVGGSERSSGSNSLASGVGHLPTPNRFLRHNVHAWVKHSVFRIWGKSRLSSKKTWTASREEVASQEILKSCYQKEK